MLSVCVASACGLLQQVTHISPLLSRQQWTEQEDNVLLQARQTYGEGWHLIAKVLPGRTEASCKVRFLAVRNLTRSTAVASRLN